MQRLEWVSWEESGHNVWESPPSWWLTSDPSGSGVETGAICWIFTANITCSPARTDCACSRTNLSDEWVRRDCLFFTGEGWEDASAISMNRESEPLKMMGCSLQVLSSWSGIVTDRAGGESGDEDPCGGLSWVVVSGRREKVGKHNSSINPLPAVLPDSDPYESSSCPQPGLAPLATT